MARDAKPRRPRLTLEIELETREALVAWADEEGRPVSNLIRRVLATVVAERRRLVPTEPQEGA